MAPMVPPAVRGRVVWSAATVAAVSPRGIGATAPPEAMAGAAWPGVIAAAARPRATVNLSEWRRKVRWVPEKDPRQTGPSQYRVHSWIVRSKANAGSPGEGAWLDLAAH